MASLSNDGQHSQRMSLLESENPLTHDVVIQRRSAPMQFSIQNTNQNETLIKTTSSGNNLLIKLEFL